MVLDLLRSADSVEEGLMNRGEGCSSTEAGASKTVSPVNLASLWDGGAQSRLGQPHRLTHCFDLSAGRTRTD